VLILVPMRMDVVAVPRLEETGSVAVVYPDDGALAAMGPNPLDPAFRAAAARAGRNQAAALADDIAEFWAD
jgi:NTE family protein